MSTHRVLLSGSACVGLIAAALWWSGPEDVSVAFVISGNGGDLDTATWWGGEQKANVRESLGVGLCWIDYDNDGDPDLFVGNGGHRFIPKDGPREAAVRELANWRFYVNQNGRFKPEPVLPVIKDWALGCAVGDVNGDGFDDLFVTTALYGNRLFLNRHGQRFEDVTARWRLGHRGLSTSAAFGDLDNDGDLDLVVTDYLSEPDGPSRRDCHWKQQAVMCGPKGFPKRPDLLYENRGTHFLQRQSIQDVTGYGLGVILFDPDGDGDSDIYIANDSNENRLFVNQGSWQFADKGFVAGVSANEHGMTQAGMGVDAGDVDNDGREDLVVSNFSNDSNNLYHHDGNDISFSDWASRSGIAAASFPYLGWATLLEDFDLDGDLDLFVVNGHVYPQADAVAREYASVGAYRQRPQLLLNDGGGRFEPVDDLARGDEWLIAGRGSAVADYDDDGDMDIVITREGQPPLLLENLSSDRGNHWLKIRLSGPIENHRGLGARVEIVAQDKRQVRTMRASRGYLSASESVLIFGLGSADGVDSVTVRWPDGHTTRKRNIRANSRITIERE